MITHLPAAPPCLVLGPNSYNVKCVYPFTRIYTHAYTEAIDAAAVAAGVAAAAECQCAC